jgi:hypothetical protein
MNDAGIAHRVDFFLSPSTFGSYADVLAEAKGAGEIRLLRPNEEFVWKHLTLRAVPAAHVDLLGRASGCIGLTVAAEDTDGSRMTLAITGDTGYGEQGKLCDAIGGCDLLVTHLGSVYDEDLTQKKYARRHLGVKGLAQLLTDLDKVGKRPKLTLISELGEELRAEIQMISRVVCDAVGCSTIVPTKLGMRVELPDASIRCNGSPQNRRCTAAATRWGRDAWGEIRYCCTECGEDLVDGVSFAIAVDGQ